MARTNTKVAVSLPTDLYRSLEKARKQRGQSRSALVQEALRFWIERQRRWGLVREYRAGYYRLPESAGEIEDAEKAAVATLAEEDW